MKKILLYSVFFLVLSNTALAEVSNDLAPFDEIVATGNMVIDLVAGEEEEVDLKEEADIKLEVVAGVLRIKRKKMYDIKAYKKEEAIKVKVTYRQLRSITGNAGAVFSAKSPIMGDQLLINMNSGASGKFEIAVNVLKLEASEGAELTMEGTAPKLDIKVSSGAKIDTYEVFSDRIYVRTHTAGEATVTAQKYLEANAGTGGVITYKGKPDDLLIKEDLGGKVNRG